MPMRFLYRKSFMKLILEQLEDRILLAAPVAPDYLGLWYADDSGPCPDITNSDSEDLKIYAASGNTVNIFNVSTGSNLGEATDTGVSAFIEDSGTVTIEAENGDITGMNTTGGGGSVGSYIWDNNTNGVALYHFYISTSGTYYVHARTKYGDTSENSFYINIDDTWTNPETGPGVPNSDSSFGMAWHFDTAVETVNSAGVKTWDLAAGWHFLEVHVREAFSELDRLVITTDPNPPGGSGDAESDSSGLYTYSFGGGDLTGSATGTENILVANATNGSDETSDLSPALTVTYDSGTNAPAAPDLDSGSDTGDSSSDDLTNDTTATFTGSAGSVEDSATVWLRIGAADTRSTTANADGSYSITLQVGDLAEGANTVDIYYIDQADNTSTDSANLTVTLDTTALAPAASPDLDAGSDTGSSNSDNLTNDTTPTFTGPAATVEADSTVWLRVGTVNTRSTTAAGDGSYSITLQAGDLAEGANDIDIIYIDPAGNTSTDSADLTVTLDTTAAAPAAAPDLNAGSDSGSSNSDNITNDTTATFSGIAGAVADDSTVWLRVAGVNIRSTTAAGDGSYSVTLLAGDLSEGDNSVDIIYIDTADNTSSDSPNLTVTLDTIMPTPSAPDLRTASDTGSSDTDNLTSDNAAFFDGYAETSATVQLYVGAVGKDTDTADASTGAFSIQLSNGDLAAGANNITVHATDLAGNTATSPALVVTYDATGTTPNAPKLLSTSDSGSSSADQITNISAAVVYGSVAQSNPVEAGATVHLRTNKNAAGWTEVGTTVADGSGNWSYTFDGVDDLAQGTDLVEVYITDLAGNDSATSADLTITLDVTAAAPASAPDLDPASDTGDSTTDNITTDTTPTFNGLAGSVEASATVWLRVDGTNTRSTTAAGDGSYSLTLLNGDLTEGTNIIDIIYIDTAGNTSADSPNLSVTLDTSAAAPAAAPDLSSASDTGTSSTDNLTNDTTTTFTGPADSVQANSTVWLRVDTVDKRSTTAAADGSYSITVQAGDLTQGINAVDIYYIDPAGNTSADSDDLSVTLDTSVADPATPDLAEASDTGSSSSDNVTSETRPTVQGAAAAVEALSTVSVWLDTPSAPDTQVGTTTAAANGSWSYTFTSASPLEEGVNKVRIVAVDPAGNTSNSSSDLNVTINFDTGSEAAPDLDAASDTGSADDDNITSDSTPTITGTCPDNAQIRLRVNSTTISSFTDNDGDDGNAAAGQWTYTFAGGVLSEGSNTIDFLTIDTSNNTTDWSIDLLVTLDTTLATPTQPDLLTADDSGSSSGDDITNVTDPTITGTAEAGSTVTIDVNAGAHTDTALVSAAGTWSYDITDGWLSEGNNTISVTATDVAGNTALNSADLTFQLDTTINTPSLPDLTAATDTGSSTTDNITTHSNPRIVGTADPNTTITVRLDPTTAPTTVGTTQADGAGDWSYTFASGVLSEGTNEIDVLSTDIAGNSDDSPELDIYLETLISVPTAPDLEAASDLGSDDTDDITSLATATVTGAADSNCTVYVRVNGTVVGSTTSNGAGSWSYTFDGVDDLIEGSNIIDANAEDSSGNISAFSDDLIITLDTTIATPTAPDLEAASDSGSIDTDNYTNVSTPTISGLCEIGATVTINLNNVDVGTATDADSDGAWTYTFAAPLNGSATGTANSIKVSQTDVAGNSSAYSTVLTVTLDDQVSAPSLPDLQSSGDTGDADDDNLTNLANVTITGTVETNSSLQLYIDQGSGPALIDTISEQLISSGTYTYTFSTGQLAQGANAVTVIATDKAANVSASSAALTITLDQTISQPGPLDLADESDTGTNNDDEVTSDVTPTFTGTADPNTHITIRVDGETINTFDADAAGDWTYTFAQGEIQTGVRRVDVIATDTAGNVSVPSEDITIWLNVIPTQPAAPNLQAASDSGTISTDNWTNITQAVIDGKADADRTVEIYVDTALKGATTADSNGFWQHTLGLNDLAEGENEVTIITEDTSGLRSSSSYPLTINFDTTAPLAPLPDLTAASDTGLSDSDNLTSDRTATIAGTTEPSALVDLYLNDEYVTQLSTTAAGSFSYTFSPTALIEGSNEIYVIVTDGAGNISAPSDLLTIVLDIAQDNPETPTLTTASDTGSSSTDSLTKLTTPEIVGTVKPSSLVEVLVYGNSVGSVWADEQGNWQYTFTSGQLSQGTNYIEVLSTDPVGNTARSAILELELDTTPPVLYNFFPRDTYTHTCQMIELYIYGNDLDNLAAADLAGYQLLGSGGDGTFDDGNEWTIPISSVIVEPVTSLVQLNTSVILTDDAYQLNVLPDTSLRDEAGNPAQLNLSTSGTDYSFDTQPLTITFTIDTAGPPAPAAPQISPAYDSGLYNNDSITNISAPLIQVTAETEISVQLICNGLSAGFANETQPGSYQLFLDSSLIRPGENLLLARAFDSLGNSSDLSEITSLVYDNQPPQVTAIVVDDLWFDEGPTQLSIVLNESRIDPTSVLDLDNYTILASGGDGTFDDGNETSIAPIAASYVSANQSILLTLPHTVTGVSTLDADSYRVVVLADSTIRDTAGNFLTQTASQEFTVVPTEIIRAGRTYSFTTSTGKHVIVALNGSGEARLLTGSSLDSDNTIEQIILRETDETSSLMIIATPGQDSLTIGRILSDYPVHSVFAPLAEITEQIAFPLGITRLNVSALQDDVSLTLTSPEMTPQDDNNGLYFTTGTIGSDVDIDITGHLQSFRATSYASGTLTAASVSSLVITQGDCSTDIDITSGDLERMFVYRGNLTGDLDVTGRLDSLYLLQGNLTGDIAADSIEFIYAPQIDNSLIRSASYIETIQSRTGQNVRISAAESIDRIFFFRDLTDSTISAGTDLGLVRVGGDALDNLFLSGSDLGPDGSLGSDNDTFADGDINFLMITGNYSGSIAAAAVDPGPDLTFFTADDTPASAGSIHRIIFGYNSLTDTTTASHSYGLIASGSISSFYNAAHLYQSPYQLNLFNLLTLS